MFDVILTEKEQEKKNAICALKIADCSSTPHRRYGVITVR